MSPELLANILFALEKVIAVLLDRAIAKIKSAEQAKEFSEIVTQYRSAMTKEEKDNAALRMEEKFKARSG